ncbi:MAG: hypothetical protein J6T10_19015 [Methanobrevibacter sp.]|nr:hypothetical protein [Methanobrevibacter sp.]
MANDTRTYKIVINGLTESIDAVKSLNEQLSNLESRINALNSKAVNVGSKSSGGSSKSSSLDEEEKLQKQIEQLEEKRKAHSKEIYQNYLAAKDVLKETEQDQKQIAAQERLAAKSYSNTISGMKQELADIKAVMQTVDVSDSGQMKQMIDRAKELNDKLKEIEQSYGQFGRNVGNYSSAFDGMQKLSISIGGVTREFNSAREASRTLKNELIGLEAAGSGNTEVAKELRSEYYKLQSAMDDATKSSKAMDEAMDMMQSFTAMASVGQGLKGFFGLDNTEIERSIQRLVSLQNVLKGIETLRKQMETSEGLGKLFSKGGENIDKMVAGLTGAKVATEGLTMGSRAATVAVRGLSMALKAVGIGLALEAINLLVQGIEWVSEKMTKWVKGDADLIKEEKLLDAQLDYVNKKLEERNDELAKSYYQGAITQEEYFRKQLEETTNVINEQIQALKEKAELEGDRFAENLNDNSNNIDLSFGAGKTQAKDIEELTRIWKLYSDAVLEGKDAMSKLSDESGEFDTYLRSLIYTLDDTKDDLVEIGQVAIGKFLKAYEHAMQTMKTDTKEGERELAELKKQMDDNEMLRTIFMNLDQYIPVEKFRKRVEQIINLIRGVKVSMDDFEKRTTQQIIRSEQLKIDAMKDGAEKRQAQRDLDKKKELADATLTAEDKQNIEKKYQNRKIKEEKEANRKSLNEAKKNNREILEAEKDLGNLRIANMKEGLNKVLKQLEEERKQRLAKVVADGKLVAERRAEIEKLYDKKILEAKKDWAEKVQNEYKNMWDKIYAYSIEIQSKMAENIKQEAENYSWELDESIGKFFNQGMSSYGAQGKNQLSVGTRIELQYVSTGEDKFTEDMKNLIDLLREAQNAENIAGSVYEQVEALRHKLTEQELEDYERVVDKKRWEADELNKIYEEEEKRLVKEYGDKKVQLYKELLLQEGYSSKISNIFVQRFNAIEYYWAKRLSFETKAAEDDYNTQLKLENEQYENEKRLLLQKWNEQQKINSDWNDKRKEQLEGLAKLEKWSKQELDRELLNTEKEYNEAATKSFELYKQDEELITVKHNANLVKLEKEKNEKIKQVNGEAYRARLQELRDFQTAITNLESKQPVYDKYGWGIINLKQTNINNRNLLNSYETLADEILSLKKKLQSQLDANEITFDDFQNANRELDVFAENVGQKMDEVKYKLSFGGQWEQLAEGINFWMQAVGQAVNSVLGSLSEITSNQYDKEIEQQEEFIQKYEELLDKQRELTQKYANEVDSIEDELATSRGDRRQHLIDQLNAEMEARRASAAEEKRIEKEKEKAEKQKQKLEHDQAVARKRMQEAQAYINMAMAISMAAVNSWPIPAIPMMALAAATGAAQIAAIKSQNIPSYAVGGRLDGGIAQGNRHRDGGIKVLGGRAEIEGGEFITNRISTEMNAPLLEFINSKKKKIDVSDLIEFYSSGSVKKSIMKMSPKSKFADGGYIPPTLSTSIEIEDRLLDSFDKYSNRPVVVSVVDINNKQEQVRQVQTLAGL